MSLTRKWTRIVDGREMLTHSHCQPVSVKDWRCIEHGELRPLLPEEPVPNCEVCGKPFDVPTSG